MPTKDYKSFLVTRYCKKLAMRHTLAIFCSIKMAVILGVFQSL